MSNRLPPLSTLQAFAAAARLRSFSHAGEELHLGQAAISRQMRNLAESLNTELFERERHGVRLTEHGRRLYATVQPFLDELEGVASGIRGERESKSTFVIYADPSTTDSLLMPTLPEVKARWPELDVQILCSDSSVTEYRHPVSLGLQWNRWDNDEDFEIVTIFEDVVFPVCAENRLTRTDVADGGLNLDGTTLLHLEQPGRTWVDWREFCRHNAVNYPTDCEEVMFTNYPALIDAAVQGYGVALAWERSITRRLDDGSLRRLGCASLPWPNGVCAYLPRRNRHDRRAREVVSWLLERFGGAK